jgi:ribosomal protein S18 acetylase RimI-like enzyme
MAGELTVRRAEEGDIVAIARFQTDAWNDAYRHIVPAEYLARLTVETRTQRWAPRILRRDRSIYVAERDGRILAVVSFGERTDDREGPRLELMSIYVGAAERGGGLGAAMVEFAIGDSPAVLWVFESNVRAIAFYRRLGFEPDGHTMIDEDTQLEEIRMTRSGKSDTTFA